MPTLILQVGCEPERPRIVAALPLNRDKLNALLAKARRFHEADGAGDLIEMIHEDADLTFFDTGGDPVDDPTYTLTYSLQDRMPDLPALAVEYPRLHLIQPTNGDDVSYHWRCLHPEDGDQLWTATLTESQLRAMLATPPDDAPPKTYTTQDNIGTARYVVSFHDGKQTHPDGSPFHDVRTFRTKSDRNTFCRQLEEHGYKQV